MKNFGYSKNGIERAKERKFIFALLATLCITPAAFTDEFTLQGAMEAALVPVQVQNSENGDISATTGLGVFGYSPYGGARFKLMSNASLDRIGMISYLRFYTSTSNGNRLDTIWLDVWVKPTDWLRFDVGSIEDWTLWGKFGQEPFAPYTQRSRDEDAIFTEFYYPSGILMTLRPSEKLFIGAGLPALKSNGTADNPNSYNPSYLINAEDAEKAYERIQAAVGYTIDGVGLVRFQYVGANPNADVSNPPDDASFPSAAITSHAKIEGAFAYTGASGLLIDAGFKIPVEFKQNNGNFIAPYHVSGGVSVNSGNFGIVGRIDSRFGSLAQPNLDADYKIKFAPDINVHLTPSYTLDTIIIGLDCGFEWIGETRNQDGDVIDGRDGGMRGGIGVFARKNFGPGSYVLSGIGCHFGGTLDSERKPSAFTIPVIFNYTSPKASLLKN
ncbi:MAG: hypothetical protein LBJ35_07900 [Spirochaetaceae bacterium]|nr:hypothetical protein [Spirochaetaceae bacterium]